VDAVRCDFSRASDKASQSLLAATLVKRGLDKWMIRRMGNWLDHQAGRVSFWSVADKDIKHLQPGQWDEMHSKEIIPSISFGSLF